MFMSPMGLEQIQLKLEKGSDKGPDRDVSIGGVAGLLVHGTGSRYWAIRQFTNVLPIEVNCHQRGEMLDIVYFFPGISLVNFPPQ